MRVIYLSQGCVAIVDDEDYELVSQYKWSVQFRRGIKTAKAYAQTNVKGANGLQKILTMHSLIMGGTSRTKMADHINGFGLDNRRENLRLVTPSQNSQNQERKDRDDASSAYKGVVWKKNTSAWLAQICSNRQHMTFGCWQTQEAAALNYDLMSLKLHKEHGRRNGVIEKRAEILANEIKAASARGLRNACIKRFRKYLDATDEEIAAALEKAA